LKTNLIRQWNHWTIRPYRTCDTLPAKKFFKALDDQDFRHILKCDYLPEYSQEKLYPIWDSIIKEYDELTGKNTFGYQLMELKHEIKNINRLNGLNAAYQLMILDQKEGLEDLKYWGVDVKVNSHNERKRVLSMILMEQTKIKIQRMRQKSIPEQKGTSFIDSLVSIEGILERNLDEDTITLTKWLSIVKNTNAKVKAIKNGKSNKRY